MAQETGKKREWEKINSKIVYENKWFKVYEDDVLKPDGTKGVYGYLHREPGVNIMAYDKNDKSIYFIEEYRYPIKKIILDFPGGSIESEDIIENAKRELYEETGIKSNNLINLGKYYQAAGHETVSTYFVLALDLDISELGIDKQDGDESIHKIFKLNINQIKEMILDGKFESGIAMTALNLFFIYAEKNNLL